MIFDSDYIAVVLQVFIVTPHAGTVVPECFKDDKASQWKSGKFDPAPSKTPQPIVTQICMGDYVAGPYPHAKLHHYTITHFCPQICENVPSVTWLVFLVFLSAYSQDPCTDLPNLQLHVRSRTLKQARQNTSNVHQNTSFQG